MIRKALLLQILGFLFILPSSLSLFPYPSCQSHDSCDFDSLSTRVHNNTNSSNLEIVPTSLFQLYISPAFLFALNSVLSSFRPQMFIEHLLCDKHSFRHFGYISGQNSKSPVLTEFAFVCVCLCVGGWVDNE